ncbi:MAG: hypothetical protein KatS3mg039_0100 [Candidatus Kapaibacterium sp.]|nr:MAG: hypothetical protein KatS3mg039_0100 [Candidatus Kapabacteria bacterium]
MRHVKRGRKLKRTESHRHALLRNMAASLIRSEQKAIRTTVAKAKELRPFVERLITKARRAYQRERSGQLAYGNVDLHYRRLVARSITDEAVLQELFEVIAPVVAERNGGYTRIVKLGYRRGDGAQEAIIQLVDWAAPQDGATSQQRKRRTKRQTPAPAAAPTTAAPQQSTEQAQPSPAESAAAEVADWSQSNTTA